MNYSEQLPTDPFSNYIKRFWRYENLSSETKSYTILPDGYFDLIIIINGSELESISLFGLWTKQLTVTIPAHTTVLGVTFKPIAAACIFNHSIAGILDSYITLDSSFWNIDTLTYHTLDELVNGLLTTITISEKNDSRKIEVFDLLFKSSGSLTVTEIAQQVWWSSRQINRYFRDWFGLSLKSYANLLRCSASYTSIRDGELAPLPGYYDQSHFIKEIKKHTGFKPKELHRNENDRFLQFFTLPKA